MEITEKLLLELQNRLKIGSRRGVHLNAIPARSRYKFDLTRLSHIDENLPQNFINALLSEQPLKFKVSWKDNVPDLKLLDKDEQVQLVKITKSFENLINQTDAIESEKGINTFGFGFPLLVRRDLSDKKLTVAPLLIWSLKIKRTKEFNTWVIVRDEEDPIYINEVLINHLQSDSQIEIEPITPELLEDGLIDKEELIDICVQLLDTINSTSSTNLRATLRENLENIKPISSKKKYEELLLTSNSSSIDFGGLFSIFEVQKQNIIQDYLNLIDLEGTTIDLKEMEEHSFQSISSVETDPSQQRILNSLKNTRNILIQGPPGTGKSQSLTAILVNALENHKKTIVVCEKITALNVLKEALDKRGLSNLNVQITEVQKSGRRNVVYSVRDSIESFHSQKYRYTHSKETLDDIIDKVKSLIDSINNKHLKIGEKLLGDKNWTHIVGVFLAQLKEHNETYKLDLEKGTFKFDSTELNNFLELIRKGHYLYDNFKPNKECSFLNSSKLHGDTPYLIEQQLKDDFSSYKLELASVLEQQLKYESEYGQLRNVQLKEQLESIDEIDDEIQEILVKNKRNEDFYQEDKTRGFFYKISSLFSKEKKQTRIDQQHIISLFLKLVVRSNECNDFNTIELTNTINGDVSILSSYKESLEEIVTSFSSKVNSEFENLNLIQEVDQNFNTPTLELLKETLKNLKDKMTKDSWSITVVAGETYETLRNNIQEIIQKEEDYFNNENDLFSSEFKWFQYYNALSKQNKIIIEQLLEKVNWKKTFLIYYLNAMLINASNMNLPTDDKDHQELVHSLGNIEEEQLKYIREYWFSKQIEATRAFDVKNQHLSVENLYNKRKSKKYKRLSLRQIVAYDLALFTDFFPVILTTPDVCSNLFKGEHQYFDIVMFDEASQLKLEDNLPALLKGKQVIIAGDEHQMPPSNYFSKIFDGVMDDEDDFEDDEIKIDRDHILLSCESLLDFASELNFEKKHLDFHYRSRHPYLIDFSNHAFYNQRLKPLPNSFEYTPIKYIQVNGTYFDHTNEVEATMVLSIIENNIHRFPTGEYPSVGIATFNIHQRNLILEKINNRRKLDSYADFNDKIVELEENGFFVKNLENIQGDERDVIILTTTYGVNIDGKFAHRFGSINHQKGYKLLNVIITRAKYKIYVCSSIPEEVILNYKEYLSVEGSNNRRAVFFAYLAYCKAVTENDTAQRIAILNTLSDNTTKTPTLGVLNEALESPFEEVVYEALIAHFDKTNIIPQLQFAGFRIDLVYDPKITGLPKIAIECDGAAHHSSEEAYLYDIHRKKILEGHGFVFHRIWSTNWWRNPEKETKKLVEFIENIANSQQLLFEDKSTRGIAFTDNIALVEDAKETPILQKDLKENRVSISKNNHKN
ncbi:MAG: DUF559 domain-containing protein [Flavobacteriaceae bacterium]|nr:DUF559 domain-containing protein [Flavobacteriaceae bacterium]